MKTKRRSPVRLAGICSVVAVVLGVIQADGDEVRLGDRGWYANSTAGINIKSEEKANPGFRLGVGGGYNFNRWLGVEFEAAFLYNSFKSGSSADYEIQVPLLTSCVLRYENETKWVPYAGVGLGVGALFNDHNKAIDPTLYQLILGVRRDITEKMSVGICYKFLGSGIGEIFNDIFDSQFGRNHAVLAGVNWKF